MRPAHPALTLLALITSTALSQPGPPPAKVFVDAATTMVVDSYRESTGSLRPARRAVVASREAGIVEFFQLSEGDTVKAGDVLVRLDDDLLTLDVDRAKAQADSDQGRIEEKTAELQNARNDLARLESLSDRGSARPVELDDARTETASVAAQLAQAEADLAAHLAELARANQRLADATITAPFDGRIVSTATELGEWLGSGGPVAELIDLDTVECWIDIPETAVEVLRTSTQPVRIRVDAIGKTLEAPVAAIIPDADPLSRLFPARIVIDNPDGTLAPGMSVTGLVPTGLRGEALTIHRDAVLVDNLGEFVYVDRAGVAAVARVQTLYATGDRVVLRPGEIKEGDRVVVEGNERIFPGQPLEILGDGAPADGARSAK